MTNALFLAWKARGRLSNSSFVLGPDSSSYFLPVKHKDNSMFSSASCGSGDGQMSWCR